MVTTTVKLTNRVSLEQTQAAMQELIQPGTPRGKLVTAKYASVLRGVADRPLPVNRDELRALLPGVMVSQLNTLYAIERLWNAGVIHFNTGNTFQDQFDWREATTAAIPGMGHKRVSFALHIYNPAYCLLLTIDCWHIRRFFGLGTNESLRRKQYLDIEQMLRADIVYLAEEEGQGYWLITYAACFWERSRQGYHASECEDGDYQTHAGISCYV